MDRPSQSLRRDRPRMNPNKIGSFASIRGCGGSGSTARAWSSMPECICAYSRRGLDAPPASLFTLRKETSLIAQEGSKSWSFSRQLCNSLTRQPVEERVNRAESASIGSIHSMIATTPAEDWAPGKGTGISALRILILSRSGLPAAKT
jgi:hypothetical protein